MSGLRNDTSKMDESRHRENKENDRNDSTVERSPKDTPKEMDEILSNVEEKIIFRLAYTFLDEEIKRERPRIRNDPCDNARKPFEWGMLR